MVKIRLFEKFSDYLDILLFLVKTSLYMSTNQCPLALVVRLLAKSKDIQPRTSFFPLFFFNCGRMIASQPASQK